MRKRIYVRLQGRLLIHVDHSIQTLQTHESFDNENRDTGGSCNYRQRALVKSKYDSNSESRRRTYDAGCGAEYGRNGHGSKTGIRNVVQETFCKSTFNFTTYKYKG